MITGGLSVQNYHFEKNSKAEHLIGLFGFILIAMVILFSFFWAKDFLWLGSIPEPKSLSITNISNRSFTITWKTNTDTNGYVLYSLSPDILDQKAYDNKATNKNIFEYKTKKHAVTLTNLNPDTYYYYKIVSEGENVGSISGKLFEPVKTTLLSPFFNIQK